MLESKIDREVRQISSGDGTEEFENRPLLIDTWIVVRKVKLHAADE